MLAYLRIIETTLTLVFMGNENYILPFSVEKNVLPTLKCMKKQKHTTDRKRSSTHGDGSFEYPHHVFYWRNKKIALLSIRLSDYSKTQTDPSIH